MRNPYLLLLSICLGCAKQPLYSGRPHPATAIVNNENWFGTPQAVKARPNGTDLCTRNNFMLFVRTDLPYRANSLFTKEFGAPTGCASDDCMATQLLMIENIPLKRGRYTLSKLDKCGTISPDKSHYSLLLPRTNSGLVRAYRQAGKGQNWVRITHFDPESGYVEGQFALTLTGIATGRSATDSTENNIQFRDGRFRAQLKNTLEMGKKPSETLR